jgi:hypothetical protein
LNNAGYGLHCDFLEILIERTVNTTQLSITTPAEPTHIFGRDSAAWRRKRVGLC